MALAGAPPAGGPDEMRKLQSQVDQLQARLDFVSSMMPLVNICNDYFQKVECEASVQLIRLQNAQVMRGAAGGGAEEDSSAQLDMVRWVHFVTDAVIQSSSSSSSSSSATGPAVEASSAPSPSISALPALARGGGLGGLGAGGPCLNAGGVAGGEGLERGTLPLKSPAPASSPAPAQMPQLGASASRTGDFLLGRPTIAGGGGGAGGAGYLTASGRAAPPRGLPVAPRHEDINSLAEPFAEPGIGPQTVEGPNGLILGAGSWATAYNEASGGRRDALRLLCTSGIVTARELADDNTVITRDHIDECVLIASEMLQTWPMDIWNKEPQEAKTFFEARLTALYQKKFGEQKG